MITLNGRIQRQFYFPADPLTTLIYFSELSRVALHLPHIGVVDKYTDNQIRIRFQTVELGAYTINIYCDLELTVDVDNYAIYVAPMNGCEPVEGQSTLNATSGYGFYNSTALLTPAEDNGTNIDYRFQFESKLERPRGLRMMPRRIVDRIAHSISMGRVGEIADGFMDNAAEAFADWLAAKERTLTEDWLAARNSIVPAAEPREGS